MPNIHVGYNPPEIDTRRQSLAQGISSAGRSLAGGLQDYAGIKLREQDKADDIARGEAAAWSKEQTRIENDLKNFDKLLATADTQEQYNRYLDMGERLGYNQYDGWEQRKNGGLDLGSTRIKNAIADFQTFIGGTSDESKANMASGDPTTKGTANQEYLNKGEKTIENLSRGDRKVADALYRQWQLETPRLMEQIAIRRQKWQQQFQDVPDPISGSIRAAQKEGYELPQTTPDESVGNVRNMGAGMVGGEEPLGPPPGRNDFLRGTTGQPQPTVQPDPVIAARQQAGASPELMQALASGKSEREIFDMGLYTPPGPTDVVQRAGEFDALAAGAGLEQMGVDTSPEAQQEKWAESVVMPSLQDERLPKELRSLIEQKRKEGLSFTQILQGLQQNMPQVYKLLIEGKDLPSLQ